MAKQETVMDTNEDYSKLKVVELKKLLRDRGLSYAGTKDELIERLKQANEAAEKKLLEETTEDPAGAATIDEELENEIMNDESKVTSTSVAKPGEKRKLAQNGSAVSEPPKKKAGAEENKENAAGKGGADKDGTDTPKKLIKISDVTPDEKKELRAKKFGMTEDQKKEARAKRFGITPETKNNLLKKGLTTNKNKAKLAAALLSNKKLTPEEEEKRKKRAIRFGITAEEPAAATPAATPTPTPTPEVKLTPEEEEKRKKRAIRFGTGAENTEKLTPEDEEKKKKRAERFAAAPAAPAQVPVAVEAKV